MSTVRDLCTDALGEIGVVDAVTPATNEDASLALRKLNQMVDQWAAERLMIYAIRRTTWTINSGVSEYNFGTAELPGQTAVYGGIQSDGFDTTWSGGPPGWTSSVTGTGEILNETTIYQAGGHSLSLNGGAGGEATTYKDFVVFSGTDASITVYYKTAGNPAVAGMRVQCVESGHYLTSAGAWQDASTYAISNSLQADFFATTVSFTVESEDVVDADRATLRITLENLDLPAVFWDTFSLTNTVTNIIAPVSGISVPRPVYIDHVNLIDTSASPDIETPLTRLTDDAWAAVSMKALTDVRPQAWYPQQTLPGATASRTAPFGYSSIILWPVPTGSTYQGAIYIPTQISQFANLDLILTLPPGYEELIVSNLAVRLAPSFSRQAHPELKQRAVDSKAIVKRSNVRLSDLSFEAGALLGNTGSTYNIRIG